ncbi:MAG: glycoside hydrolase family 140 protein [Anaerolineae bacterium]|nr:glycoside hydrolase family 140 protein [Anaerolineae bacterium]
MSENKHFLIDEGGQPFFWLADTAWELFHRCTLSETEFYLENRRQKGFNVIQAVALAELDGLQVPNTDGETPLLENDPSRPNEAYFQHIDAVFKMAANKGIYIALLPTWGDKVFKMTWGAGPEIFDTNNAYAYGKWIGTRYKDATNILWVNGGDRPEPADDVSYAPIWRALASGVKAGAGDSAFMTYHPNGGHGSAEIFHADDWLNMNMWQSGHSMLDQPNWEMITNDYVRMPIKPVLDGEPNYEDHAINPFTRKWDPSMGYFRDYDVRKQAYRAVFAGACGHTYGHHSVWQMYTQDREPINYPDRPWQDALDRPGAYQVGYLRRLMESRPYLKRIPDQGLLLSGEGEGACHIQATRANDGSYAMIYTPAGWDELTINLESLSGTRIQAWWFDPREGTARSADKHDRNKSLTFSPPSPHDDWVLVLDDEDFDFSNPAQINS